MPRFENKVALVTGGSSGIGYACAASFAREGATVIITGRDMQKGRAAAETLSKFGWRVSFLACDFREGGQIATLFSKIKTDHQRLDFAVNSAGIEGKPFTKLTEYPEPVWDEVLQVNLKAVWLCLKYEIELMRGQGGAIVNVASLAGLQASLTGGAAYTASKHGVVGLTRAAAKEFADETIRVNCVCPALIKTPMAEAVLSEGLEELGAKHHPIGRIGQPQDVASAVLWLCSPDSSFITGVALPVDGGILA